jgi:iron complex outermembrane receptor protein
MRDLLYNSSMPSTLVRRAFAAALPLAALATAPPLGAQDSTRARLPAMRVTATREGPRAPLDLPYAVTVTRPDTLAAMRRAGVDELLFAIPGVALANRQNPAQDPRVSIRGFGARSAFGVRGVRVLQDGVPVTLPDGQTPVDVLDIEGAERVEVVRGSASSLYGNAAGGVIDIRSVRPSAAFAPFARIVGGGSTPTITATGAAGTAGPVGITSSITRIVGRGYREYSDQRATKGAVRMLFSPNDATALTPLVLSARITDVTRAESPGALTRAQFDADPRQADPLAVRKGAGKTVRQGDLSLVAAHMLGDNATVDASAFGSARTLANPLTQAIVDVKRASGGASARVSGHGLLGDRNLRLSAGADAQWLNDDRQEYDNCIGAVCAGGATERGALRKNQRELVSSVGPYVRGEISLASRLLASAGVRSDAVQFRLRDRLISATNPDDSGERTMHAVSPAIGLVWRSTPLSSIYANVSSSFETPTTTELGNKPDGSAGINPELQPQRTVTFEVGTKGLLAGTGIQWDVAAFEALARDELVPFDIPNGNGRRYFRNAGRTVRRGGEVGIGVENGPFSMRAAYDYSHFRYVSYVVGTTSFAGKRIPGVPEHALMTSASWRAGRTLLSATGDLAGTVDVDDGNTAQAPGRAIFGLAVGQDVRAGAVKLAPMVAVQNIGGVRSVGSVSVNATGGKFYEPAPGRVLLVRMAVSRDR